MRCLTLWQPWASLVAYREKRYETRSWTTNYRGEIAIHAGARWSREVLEICRSSPFLGLLLKHRLIRAGDLEKRRSWNALPPAGLPFGAIVAIGVLVSVEHGGLVEDRIETGVEPWGSQELQLGRFRPAFGEAPRFAWSLEQIQRLETPIVTTGAQGLWTPSPALLAEIKTAPLVPNPVSV
jgi:hypothetical protein